MRARHGQTILEYTIIIGIVTMMLFYMGTSIKRGLQSLLKVTADQVGNQQNSDQDFSDVRQGYMNSSISTTSESRNKEADQIGYIPATGNPVEITNISVSETTDTVSNTITNGGFTETN